MLLGTARKLADGLALSPKLNMTPSEVLAEFTGVNDTPKPEVAA